ncbi:MAG: hypothetical protein ACWA5W_09140 [Phycisphaerales bacterium]
MDPLDQLGVPHPPGHESVGKDEAHQEQTPIGYGHAPASPSFNPSITPASRTMARRDVFWSNVVREILMSLASAAAHASGRLSTGPAGANASPTPVGELFDGRMGIITALGQRIPIADIVPVFSCSMDGCEADRSRSRDVQCTIFKINTPTGESYTLPISQIIGVHSLSDALMDELEEATMEEEDEDGNRVPFGFSAYTSLARSEAEPDSGTLPPIQADTPES